MVRSLLVILIPLVVIAFLFTSLPRDHPVKVVDWRPVLGTARAQAPYPVLAPTNLPETWRATQVSWVAEGGRSATGQTSPRNMWQLGFLSPDEIYVGLSQADLQIEDFVKQETRAGVGDGSSTVNGQTWQRLVSPDGRTRSLVWTQPKVTSVVSGDLPYEALESYAATLSSAG